MNKDIEQLIDTVAFGQIKRSAGPCLGLYLSPETVYLAETRAENGKIGVDRLLRIPLPSDGKTANSTLTMATDFLSDPLKVAGPVRQSMSQMHWSSKNVVVTLSHHLGLLRYFPIPAMDRRFLRTSVPIEAKKYIPIPFDALTHDFQAEPMSPDANGKARLGVLISVAQNKNLSNISSMISMLGLNLVGLEVAPCSVLRLWQAVEPSEQGAFIQVHFDAGCVRIMICDRGLPVFFREVFVGAELSMDDQRKVDMMGCLSFARKQLGLGEVAQIKLSGAGAKAMLEPWKDAFAAETGLPTRIQDTAALLSIKGGDWGGYAAIGASARPALPSPLTIDLAARDRVTEDERQTARDIIIGGAALAGLIALAGLFQFATYGRRARVLNEYKVAPDVRAALQGLRPQDIDAKVLEMKDQLARIETITGARRTHLSEILRDVVALMPENMWLVRIGAVDPLADERGELSISLKGRVRGTNSDEELNAAVQFQRTLLEDPKLGAMFDVQIALDGRAVAAAPDGTALDPQALARSLEERTGFTIDLRRKR